MVDFASLIASTKKGSSSLVLRSFCLPSQCGQAAKPIAWLCIAYDKTGFITSPSGLAMLCCAAARMLLRRRPGIWKRSSYRRWSCESSSRSWKGPGTYGSEPDVLTWMPGQIHGSDKIDGQVENGRIGISVCKCRLRSPNLQAGEQMKLLMRPLKQ